jgi:hypothetical protein
MTEARLIQDAIRVLEARLPKRWKQRLKVLEGRRRGADAVLDIIGPDGARGRLSVEAKARLVPRDVADVKAKLNGFSSDPALVVAAFFSPSTQERLRASNLNYLDLTGNVRLTLSRPGLYVETQGATTDPSPAREPSRSLRGAKAARIVRALCDFPPPLPISDLAGKAKVDISYASRLIEWLAREALLERRPRGAVQKIDRRGLIRRWATDYGVLTSNDARGYLDPRGIENLVRRIAEGKVRARYAVTGSLAANKIAPVAPARLALLYVEDIEAAAAALGLRPTKTGTNVMLLAPFDDVVFERTAVTDGLTFVAPSQAAVDLLTSPGRAPSEAEAVLDVLAESPVVSKG